MISAIGQSSDMASARGVHPVRTRQDLAAVPLAFDLILCPEVHVDHGPDLQAGTRGGGSHFAVIRPRIAFEGDGADRPAFLRKFRGGHTGRL